MNSLAIARPTTSHKVWVLFVEVLQYNIEDVDEWVDGYAHVSYERALQELREIKEHCASSKSLSLCNTRITCMSLHDAMYKGSTPIALSKELTDLTG